MAQLKQLESRRVKETVALSKEVNGCREEVAALKAALQRLPLVPLVSLGHRQATKRVHTPRGDRGWDWNSPQSGPRIEVLQDP